MRHAPITPQLFIETWEGRRLSKDEALMAGKAKRSQQRR
jgi:hypothetical protein